MDTVIFERTTDPQLIQIPTGMFLTYTDIDSREQRLVWISRNAEVQRMQWESWLSDVHYAYWDGESSVLVRFAAQNAGDQTHVEMSVHHFVFTDGLQTDSQTVYAATLPAGTVIGGYAFDDREGQLVATVFEANTNFNPLRYAAHVMRYDSNGLTAYPELDPGPFPVDSYVDYLGMSHGPDGIVVLGYHLVTDESSEFWFRAMNLGGEWIAGTHIVPLLPDQQNSGIDVYVANQTVYALYMTFSIAGPETQGGYVLGFPLSDVLGVEQERPAAAQFTMSAAFPNPFNATVTIPFQLANAERVSLSIHDLGGREVTRLVDDRFTAGAHAVVWDAENAANGIYFATLKSATMADVQKLVLIK